MNCLHQLPQFDIEVVNEGSFGGTKHIGRGTAPLKSLIADKNQHVSFVIPLTHFEKNGKSTTGAQKGQAIVRGFIEAPKAAPKQSAPVAAAAPAPAPVAAPVAPAPQVQPAPAVTKPAVAAISPTPAAAPIASEPEKQKPVAVAAPVPAPVPAPAESAKESVVAPVKAAAPVSDDSQPLKLRLSQLAVRDLKDKGGAMDKQDPALRISVGDNKPFETARYSLV